MRISNREAYVSMSSYIKRLEKTLIMAIDIVEYPSVTFLYKLIDRTRGLSTISSSSIHHTNSVPKLYYFELTLIQAEITRYKAEGKYFPSNYPTRALKTAKNHPAFKMYNRVLKLASEREKPDTTNKEPSYRNAKPTAVVSKKQCACNWCHALYPRGSSNHTGYCQDKCYDKSQRHLRKFFAFDQPTETY